MTDQPPPRRRRVDPADCPGHDWLRYTKPRIVGDGTFYNVRCRHCGDKAWRG